MFKMIALAQPKPGKGTAAEYNRMTRRDKKNSSAGPRTQVVNLRNMPTINPVSGTPRAQRTNKR